jgi:histidyl-tRNA synthetase
MPERVQVEPVSGFPEWLPNLRLLEEHFLATIRDHFRLYGFSPIETPAVERMEVLTAKGGMLRQIYSIGKPEKLETEPEPDGAESVEPTSSAGEAEGAEAEPGLGLHFDLTVPLARYVVQHANELVFPFRRYQMQKVWRGERAQKGRYREFYQCDVDIIGRGTLDLIHDAEIPCVINSTFEALRLPEFQVQISNRKVLGDLLQVKQIGPDQLVEVLRAIDKTDREGAEATRKALAKTEIDQDLIPAILDLIQCRQMADARRVLQTAGAAMTGVDELHAVIENTIALGMPESRIRPNFAIARGLDYYTGTIYETFVVGKENWGSICSGGRYDDLTSFFTSQQKYPGVGISIGLTRLIARLADLKLVDASRRTPTQVLVTMQDRAAYMKEYLHFARTLRSRGIPTEVYLEPTGLRDQIGYAKSNGIPLAVIAGETEMGTGVVTVRDLRTRAQEPVPRDHLPDYVVKKLAEQPVTSYILQQSVESPGTKSTRKSEPRGGRAGH